MRIAENGGFDDTLDPETCDAGNGCTSDCGQP